MLHETEKTEKKVTHRLYKMVKKRLKCKKIKFYHFFVGYIRYHFGHFPHRTDKIRRDITNFLRITVQIRNHIPHPILPRPYRLCGNHLPLIIPVFYVLNPIISITKQAAIIDCSHSAFKRSLNLCYRR